MEGAESGSASAVAFALAGVLFIAAISTVLVYANDRIPPPAKTRPHEEFAAEARVLMNSFVLSCGSAAWDQDLQTWTESGTNTPGLRDCPGTTCPTAVCLDAARIEGLRLADGTQAQPDGTYHYEELRALLDLDDADRHFRLVIVERDDPTAPVLLDYGQPIPDRTATQPATAYIPLEDGTVVRVTLHIFFVPNS